MHSFRLVFGRYRYRVSGDTSGYRYRPILPLYSHAIPIPVNSSVSGLEVCSGAGDTGTAGAPRGLRGDRFGAYGVSVVSGTELHGATAGRGYAAKSCCVKAASPRAL